MLWIAFSFQIEDLGICGEALDNHKSGGFCGKDLVPVSEDEVGGHNCAKTPAEEAHPRYVM
jgi:hypothetical protein